MVVADSVAEDVILEGLASVVFDLMIGLVCCLRRQEVVARTELIRIRLGAGKIGSDRQFNPGRGIEDTASRDRVRDLVAELRVACTNAVRVRAGVEVDTAGMARGVV